MDPERKQEIRERIDATNKWGSGGNWHAVSIFRQARTDCIDLLDALEKAEAENARLRSALEAVAAWLIEMPGWDSKRHTEIYHEVAQALGDTGGPQP